MKAVKSPKICSLGIHLFSGCQSHILRIHNQTCHGVLLDRQILCWDKLPFMTEYVPNVVPSLRWYTVLILSWKAESCSRLFALAYSFYYFIVLVILETDPYFGPVRWNIKWRCCDVAPCSQFVFVVILVLSEKPHKDISKTTTLSLANVQQTCSA